MKLDIITNELKNHIGDFVQNDAKEALLLWLKNEALPAVKEIASVYTAALIESSEQETGWCKFRDRVFLPCVIDGGLWFIGKALDNMVAKQGDGLG